MDGAQGDVVRLVAISARYESSWKRNDGVDTSKPASNKPETMEAGAWQVSADPMSFGSELRDLAKRRAGTDDADKFRAAMKNDHPLAMEYAARLLRRTTRQNGPVRDHEIDRWLSRGSVDEFMALLDKGPAVLTAPAETHAALRSDDRVQRGLLILSRYFNAHGWYWGAAFPTEDAMHFEVSRELLQKWRNDGLL